MFCKHFVCRVLRTAYFSVTSPFPHPKSQNHTKITKKREFICIYYKNVKSPQRIAEPGAEGIDDGFLQGLGFANPFVQIELLYEVPQPPRELHRTHLQCRFTPPLPHLPLQPFPELLLIDAPYEICCLPFDKPQSRTISIGTRSMDSASKACRKFIEYAIEWVNENAK